jgi:hypothetical protein
VGASEHKMRGLLAHTLPTACGRHSLRKPWRGNGSLPGQGERLVKGGLSAAEWTAQGPGEA